MHNKPAKLFFFSVLSILLVSCGTSEKPPSESQALPTAPDTLNFGDVVGIPYKSEALPNAALTLDSLAENTSGETSFRFGVSGFELGEQTPGAESLGLANSGKGQHIHFILDNAPYKALYEPASSSEIAAGEHVLLAFLSRSYHESVKNENSFVVRHFWVGDTTSEQAINPEAPHLFYSRPKGTYAPSDAGILLDFFLANTTLAPDGNQVVITVNGQSDTTAFWTPYLLKGLPVGEHTVGLHLIDNAGKTIEGPFNDVQRTFKIEEANS